ncbi:hypothetical protein ABZW18_06275 [Streptomyces sp. NPDC004647]|uniref:MmyB family transcriptional regulator n=1 Tax=Streptomyces sp. NPDC004647 TaxID=3154671 RepID=UPI0033A81CE9
MSGLPSSGTYIRDDDGPKHLAAARSREDVVGADTAAMLRMDAGRHPDDVRLSELVVELAAHSKHFRVCWAERRVHERTEGTKGYHHPVVGDLTVTYQALALPGGTDQTLFVYTAEPGSPSETALRLLASWSGKPLADDGARTAVLALLYWESLTTSLREIRNNFRPIALQATGLVLVTALPQRRHGPGPFGRGPGTPHHRRAVLLVPHRGAFR